MNTHQTPAWNETEKVVRVEKVFADGKKENGKLPSEAFWHARALDFNCVGDLF